jgi:hypothetical protein
MEYWIMGFMEKMSKSSSRTYCCFVIAGLTRNPVSYPSGCRIGPVLNLIGIRHDERQLDALNSHYSIIPPLQTD